MTRATARASVELDKVSTREQLVDCEKKSPVVPSKRGKLQNWFGECSTYVSLKGPE